MRVFLLGFLGVVLAASETTLVLGLRGSRAGLSDARGLWVFLALILWPTLGAFLSASAIEWRRPRRLFQPLTGRWKSQLIRGIGAGFLTVILYPAAIPFADAYIRAEIILAAAGILGAAAALLTSARANPGTCRRCGYDLTESLSHDRCPECGETIRLVAV